MQNEPIIDMHDTWLVINSIQGCTNGCKYCFLQATESNYQKPKKWVSEEEAINQLLAYRYYKETIPVCILPGTDPFLNKENSNYVKNILDLFLYKKLKNPIVLITKCLIPQEILETLKKMQQEHFKIVIYLSYSGLPKEYEPNRKEEDTKKNFENISALKIPIIHYYRPFLKENSNPVSIKNMLDYVHQYTNYSVITGLKVRENFIDKLDFLEKENITREECLLASSIWPKEAYTFFFEGYNHPHRVFQTNYCALASALKEVCPAYYNTLECKKYNHCSEEQRIICSLYKKEKNIYDALYKEISSLGYTKEDIEIEEKENNIILTSDKLTISDVAYLTRVLKCKISLKKKKKEDIHFNSSLTNTGPKLY